MNGLLLFAQPTFAALAALAAIASLGLMLAALSAPTPARAKAIVRRSPKR